MPRLGNVPLLDPPKHDFQEIPFYEWTGTPIYPEIEKQEEDQDQAHHGAVSQHNTGLEEAGDG